MTWIIDIVCYPARPSEVDELINHIKRIPWTERVKLLNMAKERFMGDVVDWLAENFYDSFIGECLVYEASAGNVDNVKRMLEFKRIFLVSDMMRAVADMERSPGYHRSPHPDDIVELVKLWIHQYQDYRLVVREFRKYRDRRFDEAVKRALERSTDPQVISVLESYCNNNNELDD